MTDHYSFAFRYSVLPIAIFHADVEMDMLLQFNSYFSQPVFIFNCIQNIFMHASPGELVRLVRLQLYQ